LSGSCVGSFLLSTNLKPIDTSNDLNPSLVSRGASCVSGYKGSCARLIHDVHHTYESGDNPISKYDKTTGISTGRLNPDYSYQATQIVDPITGPNLGWQNCFEDHVFSIGSKLSAIELTSSRQTSCLKMNANVICQYDVSRYNPELFMQR
jgi:hypothetical protein